MSTSLTHDQLLSDFHSYGTPPEQWRIGGEFERLLLRPDGCSVPYDGPHGIRWVLESLQRDGWQSIEEAGHPIALRGHGASITLEPGGQLELSGAPHLTLAELDAEIRADRAEILAICADAPVVPVAVGLTPFAAIEDIRWMPKGRYHIMQDYLPGDRAHYMMKGTASVQCNYDFTDEADCARKVHLAATLAPLTTALFANSPLYRGKPTGWQSYRGHIWTRTDPDRTGFPPGLRADYSHEQWVRYLLDVPMMFYKRDGAWLHARGRSFRMYMTEGIEGHFPQQEDWDLHMTSVFPEVRIKQTIEVRGADCVPLPMSVAFCALFTGLFYSAAALDQALVLADELAARGTAEERFTAACRAGLGAQLGGRTLGDWARDLGRIAAAGLADWAPADAHFLDPLLERIDAGRTLAEELLEAHERDPSPAGIINHIRY